VRIIKEVCFVKNHAKLGECRGVNILAFLILIQIMKQEARHGKESVLIDA
jgi:hypothetical protein